MRGAVPSRWFNTSRTITLIIGISVVILGCIVLAGWVFDVELLKGIVAGLATMKSQTAVTFILTGLSLITIRQNGRLSWRITSRILGGFVAAIGFAVLAEYGFSVNLGIDQFPIRDLSRGAAFPGRMAPATAMAFVMIGFGFLLIDKSWRRGIRPAQWCALAGGSISAVAVIGYMLDVPSLYRFSPFSTVALHTAFGLGISAAGILLSRPGVGLVEIFYSEGVGGTIARRLFPGAVVTPIVVVWLVGRGEAAGMYGPGLSRALDALALTLGLTTLIWWSGVNLDRSQRDKIKTQEELQNIEERLRLATDYSNTGLWDWDLRTNEVYFSSIWKRQIGYAEDEIPNHFEEWQSRVHPDDLAEALAKVKAYVAKPWPNFENEFRFRHKEGSYRWILAKASVLLDDRGVPARMLGSHLDVTERKHAEEALRLSEIRFRRLFEQANDGIFVIGSDNRYLDANARGLELLGYSKDELLRMNVADVLAPHEKPRLAPESRLMMSGIPHLAEWEHVRKDGSTFPGEVSARPIAGESYLAIVRDLTQRRLAEEALRAAEEQLRLALEAAHIGTFDWNIPLNRITWSRRHEELWGFRPGEFGGTFEAFAQRVHPDDLVELNADVADCMATHKSFVLEFRVIWPDGSVHWVSGQGEFYYSDAGEPRRMRGAAIEITERKRAQDIIQEQMRLLSESQRIAHIGSWAWDLATTSIQWSDEAYRIYGLTRESFIPEGESFLRLIVAEDRPLMKEWIRACVAGEHPGELEFRAVLPTGEIRTLSGRGDLYRSADGTPASMVGTIQDITERKVAEASLRESEAKFSAAFHTSPAALVIVDTDGRIVEVNQAFCDLIRYAREEIIGKTSSEIGIVTEDARQTIVDTFEDNGRRLRNVGLTIHAKDGSQHEVMLSAVHVWLNGVPHRLSTMVEVTERNRSERMLQVQAGQLRALSVRLQKAREEERAMVARDLHDQIGQILTAIKMDVAWAANHTSESGAVQNRLKTTVDLISEGVQSVRKICTELRPGVLDDLGLSAAIEWQANEFTSRTGITCFVTVPPDDLDLNGETSIALFRIFQEALTNVARHANANSVQASLRQDDAHVLLQVHDDGRGISHVEVASSLGILGMKERAQGCGGEVSVCGKPGEGTTVTVRIPLHNTIAAVSNHAHSDSR